MLHRYENGAIFTMITALLFILFWTSESFISAANLSTTTTIPSPSRHVISFLNQQKSKHDLDDDILETAINVTENIDTEFKKNLTYQMNIIRLALKRLRLPLDDFDRNVLTRQIHDDDNDSPATGEEAGNNEEGKNSGNSHNNMNSHKAKDGRPSFANNFWHHARSRLETLEPFHNLLNTIRERIHGNRSVALTPQHRKKSHSMHLLHQHKEVSAGGGGGGGGGEHSEHHESAIETENERIMINESTGFHVLELIGTIVGLVWGFFTNLQGIFAASSGGASGASSGSSANTQHENGTM